MRLIVFISLFMLAAVIAAGSYGMISSTHSTHATQTCEAPCVVKLPDNTLEDEWTFDYGWKDKHTPVVGVYANAGHAATDDFIKPDCPAAGPELCGIDDVAISQDARGNVTLVQGLKNGRPIVTLFDASLID
jgi:hypothetical protein